jgi:hypothetical protein
MKVLVKLATLSLVIPTLLALAVDGTQAQTTDPVLPNTAPNTVLQVKRQSGICPATFGVWTASRQYEGGGEFTVIADTAAIAGLADLTSSAKKFVEYTAPLKRAYASCVGRGRDQDFAYQVRFQNGNVVFRIQLPPDTPSNPSAFTTIAILTSRPYVKWQIAD